MQLRTALLGLLACAALLAVNTAARADIINEVEPNNPFANAQNVNAAFSLNLDPNIGTGAGGAFVNTSTIIPHATVIGLVQGVGTVDFFSFTTTDPGIIILDIDSSPQNTNFDTHIHLFTGAGVPLASSDDNGGDPGDGPGLTGGAFNSRIQTGVQPAGTFVAAVSAFPSAASAGGNVTNTVPPGGTFTLNISAQVQQVPEPATLALLGLGAVSLIGLRLRRKAVA